MSSLKTVSRVFFFIFRIKKLFVRRQCPKIRLQKCFQNHQSIQKSSETLKIFEDFHKFSEIQFGNLANCFRKCLKVIQFRNFLTIYIFFFPEMLVTFRTAFDELPAFIICENLRRSTVLFKPVIPVWELEVRSYIYSRFQCVYLYSVWNFKNILLGMESNAYLKSAVSFSFYYFK